MPKHTCETCGKEFTRPYWLRKHKERKTPCAPIAREADLGEEDQKKQYGCVYCHRRFTTYTSMRRHVRTTCKIAPNERNGEEGMEKLYDHIAAQQRVNEQQQAKIEELSNLVKTMMAGGAPTSVVAGDGAIVSNVVANQIQTQNNIRNHVTNEVRQENHIHVNIFGQERAGTADHITAPQIYRLLMNAKGSADPGIQALLDTALVVFSDPEKPENITCYLPNKKTSDALVHEQSGWQIKPIETVLSPMVQRSLDVLFRKQPYGHEPGLPDQPDIVSCGEVLKQAAALEADPVLAR